MCVGVFVCVGVCVGVGMGVLFFFYTLGAAQHSRKMQPEDVVHQRDF